MVKAFQEYTEPEDATPASPQRRAPTAGEDEAVVLPLGENTLTHNLGIPVLIVCTKVNTYLIHTIYTIQYLNTVMQYDNIVLFTANKNNLSSHKMSTVLYNYLASLLVPFLAKL